MAVNRAVGVWKHKTTRVGPALRQVLGAVTRDPQSVLGLGSLQQRWEAIVGANLARHTSPRLLRQGTLVVACRNGAWMQAVHFEKERLLGRIRTVLPAVVVQRLRLVLARSEPSEQGAGPAPSPAWPDWHDEAVRGEAALPPGPLTAQIARARAKSQARLAGLLAEGLVACPACGVTLQPANAASPCAPCRYQAEQARRQAIRLALGEQPWLDETGLQAAVPQSGREERERVRCDLAAAFALELDTTLGELALAPNDEVLAQEARVQICRLMMLFHRLPPAGFDPTEARWWPLLPAGWTLAWPALAAAAEAAGLPTSGPVAAPAEDPAKDPAGACGGSHPSNEEDRGLC